MDPEVHQLVGELKQLRRGRGIENPDIEGKVGTALCRVLGIREGDGPAQTRRRVAECLQELLCDLPTDLRFATGVAFGLGQASRVRMYTERVEIVARQLGQCNPRTAQRRIDEGIRRVAERAWERSRRDGTDAGGPPWRTADLKSSVVLDLPMPEVIETRRIVATRDGLAEVELAVTLTPGEGGPGSVPLTELGVDMLYGGVLAARVPRSSNRVGFLLRLPRALARHDEHEYAFRVKWPPRMQTARHYVCTPRYPCASFQLHVRFGPDRMPASVWRLHRTMPLELADSRVERDLMAPDSSGEVHACFTDLQTNLSYGVAWSHDASS